MKTNLDFSGLSEPVAKKLASYLEGLIKLLGENLKSVVVYGSAVAGDFDPKRSNINLLVVVERLELSLLHDIQPYISRWARKGMIAPLFLTCEHMNTSSDVFPIEFLDMSDFHKVVLGDDPFAKLDISRENLRLECEEKIKGSLISLRQSYLEIADRRVPMMNLVASSITGMVSVFRGLVRLAGKSAPAKRMDVVDAAAGLYGFDKRSFHKALEIKHLAPRMTRQEMDSFYSSYLSEIEKIAIQIDKMGKKARKEPVKEAQKPKVMEKAKKTKPKPVSKKKK